MTVLLQQRACFFSAFIVRCAKPLLYLTAPLAADKLHTSLQPSRSPNFAWDGGTQVRRRNVGMMALAYFYTLLLFLFLRLVFHRSVTNRRVTTEHGLSLSLSLFQQARCQSGVCFHHFKIVFVGHCLLLRMREIPDRYSALRLFSQMLKELSQRRYTRRD